MIGEPMPALVALNFWLELVGSMFPAASFVAATISLLYLAHHGWKSRQHWRLSLPGSRTRYLKKLHEEYGHLSRLGHGRQVAFYVLASHPSSVQSFNSVESYEIEALMNWALLEKKSLLITSAPLTGKTTFLQALALRLVAREQARKLGFARPRLPFYIPMRVIDPRLPFLTALTRGLAQLGMPLSPRSLRRALGRGRAIFLFDGWEEIPACKARRELMEWLEQGKLIAGPRIPFLVACPADFLLHSARFNFPHFIVALRNTALQNIRSLRAVSETRMPPIYKHPFEENAEYILISPPATPGILRGAKKEIPLYYFHLSQYPVTNRLYRAFVQARRHREPAFWHEPDFAGEDLPVVGVDDEDAEAYCDWLNQLHLDHFNQPQSEWEHFIFRLPTEEEWEWAAGRNERLYPWGDSPPDNRHANFECEVARLSPVIAHPLGATPEGVMDMAGNAWEWTCSPAGGKKEKRIVRGGAAFNGAPMLRCLVRQEQTRQRSRFIGFRVARVPKEQTKL